MQTTVIYDGDCPFCENYTQLMKLRQIGDLELIDARQRPDVVRDLNARGIRLDSGMVVLVGGQFFHGADAMRKLSMNPGTGSAFSRLNRMVFANRWSALVVYPVLRLGRRLTLLALGRRRIDGG
jgi:predicted DCC family thiol-disulfide oxidoreductase YuxK